MSERHDPLVPVASLSNQSVPQIHHPLATCDSSFSGPPGRPHKQPFLHHDPHMLTCSSFLDIVRLLFPFHRLFSLCVLPLELALVHHFVLRTILSSSFCRNIISPHFVIKFSLAYIGIFSYMLHFDFIRHLCLMDSCIHIIRSP